MTPLRACRVHPTVATLIALALHWLPGTAWSAAADPRSTLRVMTFNVLHDGARSLAGPWSVRRKAVVATIRSTHPDVACLQEVSPRQLHDIAGDLGEYRVFAGAMSGGTRLPGWASPSTFLWRFFLGDFFDHGERCPILVRKGCGTALDSDSFLLTRASTTPHVVNWVRLRLRSGALVDLFNTHLGLVRGRTSGVPDGLFSLLDRHWRGTQILAGDFNALPSSPLLRSLVGPRASRARAFQDVWAGAKPGARGGTYHWGLGLPGPRLDYILVRPPCAIDAARISGTRVDRALPSDHYAVVADLRLPSPNER
jgi:endonuclease/exonuclease/phosphatase family metal-dependent hydrolase